MSGRLGGVKIVILPNRDHAEGDPGNSHTHTLYFGEGTPTQPQPAEHAPAEKRERPRTVNRQPKQQIEDDPLPF